VLRAVEKLIAPKDGETACGDVAIVRVDGERTLLAVIDALGHGTSAAAVATTAQHWLESASLAEGIAPLVAGLHAELRGGRGACGLLCILEGDWLEGCSVGNVDMRFSKSKPPFVLTPGVFGQRIERARLFRTKPVASERIVIFTDGISARFDLLRLETLSTTAACRAIFAEHRRPHDDATVLVADFAS
jgi:phosphoserine phosphatase RsbX